MDGWMGGWMDEVNSEFRIDHVLRSPDLCGDPLFIFVKMWRTTIGGI